MNSLKGMIDENFSPAKVTTTTLLIVIAILFVEFVRRRLETFSIFKRRGIPGPEPSFFIGNLREFKQKGHTACFAEWFDTYGGKNVGYFIGCRPYLLTKDTRLLQKILVKESASNFHSRAEINFLDSVHPVGKHHLPFLQDYAYWKHIRQFVTVAFTNVRLKQMIPMLEAGMERFLAILRNQHMDGNVFDMNDLLRRLALDNISRAAFGIDADVQNATVALPPILRKANLYLDNILENYWEALLQCVQLPFQKWFLTVLSRLGVLPNYGGPMIDEVSQFVRARANLKDDPRQDFMRTLLDARSTLSGSEIRLTESEVISTTAINYIAGFDTTSTTMSSVLFRLIKHSEWQQRLRDEIQAVWRDGATQDEKMRMLSELKATERFIFETLRMDPSVPLLVSRMAVNEFEHDGVRYPKGLVVQVPQYQLHNDPDLYPEPDKFDPGRFQKKMPPMAFQAFGEGPRNCIGMRFAMAQMKIMLVKLLPIFELYGSDRLEQDGLRYVDKAFFIQSVELPVYIRDV